MLRGFVTEGLPLYRGAVSLPPYRFIDIGANLLDDMFCGSYRDKQRHAADLSLVIDRAKSCGLERIICTAGTSEDSARALSLVSLPEYSGFLSSTVGVHPTQCKEFDQERGAAVIQNLLSIIDQGNLPAQPNKVVALGECGLDYARLEFCPRELQLVGFQMQLDLAERVELPMFLHNRETEGEFLSVVTANRHKMKKGGVVHSFDGSMEEMQALTALGLHIGINGCSLRGEENLRVAAAVPEHLLLFETDAPWCGIKPTHPSHAHVSTAFPNKKPEKYQEGFMVKDRNEPCTIRQVCEVVASVRGADPAALADTVLRNSHRLFFG